MDLMFIHILKLSNIIYVCSFMNFKDLTVGELRDNYKLQTSFNTLNSTKLIK